MSGLPLEGHCPPRRRHHTQRTESRESRSLPPGRWPQKPFSFILHGALLIHLVSDTRQYSLINTHVLGQNPAPLHGSNCSRSSPWLLPVAADKPPSLLFCQRVFLLSGATGHPGSLHVLPVPALGSANPTEPGGGRDQDRGTDWQLLFKIPYSTSDSVSCFSGGNFHI